MANKDFVIGDRVIVRPDHYLSGETGTVVQLIDEFDGRFVGVEFDQMHPEMNDCGGLAKECHGWYIDVEYLVREPQEKLCPPDLSLLTTL